MLLCLFLGVIGFCHRIQRFLIFRQFRFQAFAMVQELLLPCFGAPGKLCQDCLLLVQCGGSPLLFCRLFLGFGIDLLFFLKRSFKIRSFLLDLR